MLQRMVSKKIGKRTEHFTASGETLFDLCQEMEKLSFGDVPECGLCKSDDLYLKSYLTKEGYKYVKIICNNDKCGASVTFGHPKGNDKISYLRRTEKGSLDWQKYEKQEKKNPGNKDDFVF